MDHRLALIALALLGLSVGLQAQVTTDSKDVQVAKQRLYVDTAYVTQFIRTLNSGSTHRQVPTGKAVWDAIAAVTFTLYRDTTLKGNGTSGNRLGINPMGATNGQVLKYSTSLGRWAPASDDGTNVAAGTGISIAGSPPNITVTNTGDTNASDNLTTSTTFAGDVTGLWNALTVSKIQNRTVATTAPTNGQVYKWNSTSSQWEPSADNNSGGTVTSVALSLPSFLSVTGSPVTGSGTLTATLATQTANTVFAGPTTGTAAAPTFRPLVGSDLPTLSSSMVSDFTEAAQDAVFPAVVAGSNITVSYNDAANQFTITGASASGITSLNALTAATQTFATGTSGTDFNISSATSTHTFNLPTASATNRGALSSADWSTFNSKVGGSGTAGQVAFWGGSGVSGDNTFFWDNTNKRLGIGTNTLTGAIMTTTGTASGNGAILYDLKGDIQTTAINQTITGFNFNPNFANRGTHTTGTIYRAFNFVLPANTFFRSQDYAIEYATSLTRNNNAGLVLRGTGAGATVSPLLSFVTGDDTNFPSLWFVDNKSGSAQTFNLVAGAYDVLYLRKGDNRPGNAIFGGLSSDKTYNDASILSRNRWDGAPAAIFARRTSSTTADLVRAMDENLSTTYWRVTAGGLTGLGTNPTDSRLDVAGPGTTSGTFSSKFKTSAGTVVLATRDDGATQITGSTGTATAIMGRDGSGWISNVSLGATLALTSGTLSLAQQAATTGQVLQWSGTAWAPATISTGSGTVTSVGLSLPGIFSVSGSPVTTSGTLAATLATQTANTVFAGPTTGVAAAPTFRSLVTADLPPIPTTSVTGFDEGAQDATAAAFAAGSHTGISVTYNDASNSLSLALTGDLYRANGTLTGARTVTLGTNALVFVTSTTTDAAYTGLVSQTYNNSSTTNPYFTGRDQLGSDRFYIVGAGTTNYLRSQNGDIALQANGTSFKTLTWTGAGGLNLPPSTISSPTNGTIWVNAGNDVSLQKGGVTRTLANIEDDLQGTGVTVTSGTWTVSGNQRTVQADCTGGSVTLTLGGAMLEGRDYYLPTRNNGAGNTVTFSAASGYQLSVSGNLAYTSTHTATAQTHYLARRLNTTIFIR